MQTHEQQIMLAEVQAKLARAEKLLDSGKLLPAKECLTALQEKYGIQNGEIYCRLKWILV